MDLLRTDDGSLQSVGLSRRDMFLRIGAGSIAIAVVASALDEASAQDATPADTGLPPGVGLTPLISIPIADMPTEPFSLSLTRLTVEPGATVPNSSVAWPEIAYTEAGTLICPGDVGRWVFAPDGSVSASGAGDLEVPTGSAIYVAPNALDGARNDGTDPISALIIDLIPTEDMGTPTS